MAKPNRSTSTNSNVTFLQQGDVLVFATATIPSGARPRADGILAFGEATGHAHRLTEATDGMLYETDDGTLYLRVGPQKATITHEEHRPLLVPAGEYRISRVKEYDHFLEESRVVRD